MATPNTSLIIHKKTAPINRLQVAIENIDSYRRLFDSALARLSHDAEVATAIGLVKDLVSRDWSMDTTMQPAGDVPDTERAEVGSYAASLFDLIVLNSEATARLEKRSLDALFRKIASRDHPDRGGPNAHLFALAVKARKAKNLPVLYWLWVQGGGAYLDAELSRMTDQAEARFDLVRGLVGRVVSAHVSGTDTQLRKEVLSTLANLSRRLTRKHVALFQNQG